MKNTLKSLLAIAAIGSASVASAALIPNSGSVTVNNTPFDGGTGSYSIGGGEFKAEIAGFESFYTFCVELDQHISLPGTYDYQLSNAVDVNGDVISKGTAFLYELFAKGKLYDRTLDAAHDAMAGYLQAAIWILEEEDYSSKSVVAQTKFFNVATNPFIAKAVNAFGSLANAMVNDDLGKVKVMNLTVNGEQVQDVLVYVPDSGATLALLGFGLTGLALARRRRS